jgi:hypothetical protein
MTKLLVTTALEKNWGTDEPLTFIGEWSRLYKNKSTWEQRQHTVLPYHWTDWNKLHLDHLNRFRI